MPDKVSPGESGNLMDDYETTKLKEFRRSIQDILEPHHDDTFIKRYLIARDFDLCKAEKMIRESFKFRKNIGADRILNGKYDYPEVYKRFPLFHRIGFAHDNSVVQLMAVGPCDIKGFVKSLTLKEIKKVFVYLFEGDLKVMREHKKEMNVPNLDEQITFVIDFRNLSVKHFYDKKTIKVVIELINMYQDNYPEIIKRSYFVNVPSFFPWAFSIFKPFMNEVTLSKIRLTDNWQDELREIIDLKDLPAFLGGEFMDPDGDVYCSNLICWDYKIPQYYFLNNRTQPTLENMIQAIIDRRAILQVPAEVIISGSVLRWFFRTKLYNIRFGLFYKDNIHEMEEVLSVEEVESHFVTEENEIVCRKGGTYILYFDNSYSWMTAKQLSYKVEIISPYEIENDN